jgi:hypothetical protein
MNQTEIIKNKNNAKKNEEGQNGGTRNSPGQIISRLTDYDDSNDSY